MIIKDEDESLLEKFFESWCKIILFILFTIISLSPLVMAIVFTILLSPWWLLLLVIYLFIGPFIVLGYIDLLDLAYLL